MSANDQRVDTLVSDRALHLFEWVVFTAVCNVVDVFGVGANIINIICFVKLGFKDPANVSLLGKIYI